MFTQIKANAKQTQVLIFFEKDERAIFLALMKFQQGKKNSV